MNNKLKAGVIGDPISHSLSPKIHNFFLEKYKINGNYEAILVKKENLAYDISNLINQGFRGFNVTIPHKEEVFKICDFKSKTANLTKAVNTVIITPDNKIFGHNSDSEGFLNNLKESQPDFELKNKNAFVIGAGGAARAIIYALIKNEIKNIFITNRNEQRCLNLIDDFKNFSKDKKCQLHFLSQNEFENKLDICDILINSTSLGMQGVSEVEIDLEKLSINAIVYDIVYKPLETKLLKLAKLRGNRTINGIGMLIHQALIGFEAWFGKKPEIDKNLVESLCK
jgi:shikimate dehydrogenase